MTIHEKKKKLLLWQFTFPLRGTVSMTNHSNDFFSRITRIGFAAVFSFVKWVMSVSWDETIGNRFVARNKGKFFSFICPSRNTPNRDETPRQIEIVPIRTRASLSLGTIGDTKCFFFLRVEIDHLGSKLSWRSFSQVYMACLFSMNEKRYFLSYRNKFHSLYRLFQLCDRS